MGWKKKRRLSGKNLYYSISKKLRKENKSSEEFELMLNSLSLEGRLVMIGLMGGAETSINLALMLMKRLRIIGSTLRNQPISTKTRIMYILGEYLWPFLESGDIKPIIDTIITIEEAEKAHELIASNKTFGKVVLKVN